MNFAKSDQVRLQRTKILSSKKGQFRQIKNNKNTTLKNLLEETQKLTNRLNTQLPRQNSKQKPVKKKHGSALDEQNENNCHKSILLETLWR